MADSEKLQAELKEKHQGQVTFWEYEDYGLVAAARPEGGYADFKAFFDEANSGNLSTSVALCDFALKCIVYPDKETAQKLLEDYPDDAPDICQAVREELLGGNIEQGKGDNEHTKPLREKHGKKLAWWDLPGYGSLVVTRPKALNSYHSFLDGLVKASEKKSGVYLDFVLACVAVPDRTTAEAALKHWPGLIKEIGDTCRGFCSGGAKKLGKA